MLTAEQIVEAYKKYEMMYDSNWLHDDLIPSITNKLDMLTHQLSSIRVSHNSFIERSEALLEPEDFFANKLAGNPVGCQCEACELAGDLIPFEQGRNYTTGMINIG